MSTYGEDILKKNYFMVNAKSKRGATLTELIVSISILVIVVSMATSAVFSAIQSYALTERLQDDEYNIRMAALSISREIHRGVIKGGVDFSPPVLTLKMVHGGNVEYTFKDGELTRTKAGSSDIPFATVKLQGFSAEEIDGKIRLKLTGEYTGEIEMTVAISRVPS